MACDECLRWANADFTVPHIGQAAESPGSLDVEGGVSNRLAQEFALSGCIVAKLNNKDPLGVVPISLCCRAANSAHRLRRRAAPQSRGESRRAQKSLADFPTQNRRP